MGEAPKEPDSTALGNAQGTEPPPHTAQGPTGRNRQTKEGNGPLDLGMLRGTPVPLGVAQGCRVLVPSGPPDSLRGRPTAVSASGRPGCPTVLEAARRKVY